MILGDSLQVMASLAEREGLRGKVQCIYLDPPYGIKFNSNFQWASLNSDTSRPFARPASGRIAVKVINHLGDEVMKVFRV